MYSFTSMTGDEIKKFIAEANEEIKRRERNKNEDLIAKFKIAFGALMDAGIDVDYVNWDYPDTVLDDIRAFNFRY